MVNQMSSPLRPEGLSRILIPVFSGIQIWRRLLATHAPISSKTCETFFIFEAVTFQLLQLCLDAILFLRSKSCELLSVLLNSKCC